MTFLSITRKRVRGSGVSGSLVSETLKVGHAYLCEVRRRARGGGGGGREGGRTRGAEKEGEEKGSGGGDGGSGDGGDGGQRVERWLLLNKCSNHTR